MAKTNQEIMEILEAFDLTRSVWSAAQLAGCDPKTVAHCVERRDTGNDPYGRARRRRLVDPYADKIEELVDHFHAKVHADVFYDRLVATASPVTSAHSVAPWLRPRPSTAPGTGELPTLDTRAGMWLQYDWGWGPVVVLRQTFLFCAWLAWSRYGVIIPT